MPAYRNWQLIAWVAGVFSVLVGLTMLLGRLSIRAEDPLKSPQLKQYKEKLRLNPADEQTKQRIRQLDLQLRQRYFRQLSRMGSGVYLLLGGLTVFVLAVNKLDLCKAGGNAHSPDLVTVVMIEGDNRG